MPIDTNYQILSMDLDEAITFTIINISFNWKAREITGA